MFFTWSMACFTTNARTQIIELQLPPVNSACRVAAKALLRLLASNHAAQCILERDGHCRLVTDSEIEFANLLEVTDACFVKHVLVAKQISLPDVALAETIKNRVRDRVYAVRNGVNNRLALTRNFVSVRTVAEGQLAARSYNSAIRRHFQCLGHRCMQLCCFLRVTINTSFVADETNATRIGVGPPFGEESVCLCVTDND